MNIDDLYSFDENGCLIVKAEITFKHSMVKQRTVQAIEEYIECTCGTEMKYLTFINSVGIWQCPACKLKTATIYNILNPLKKVVSNEIV